MSMCTTQHCCVECRGEASPLEQKCFLIVLQGLRNVAAVANHLLSGTDVMQLATDTIECAARMTISGVEYAPEPDFLGKSHAETFPFHDSARAGVFQSLKVS